MHGVGGPNDNWQIAAGNGWTSGFNEQIIAGNPRCVGSPYETLFLWECEFYEKWLASQASMIDDLIQYQRVSFNDPRNRLAKLTKKFMTTLSGLYELLKGLLKAEFFVFSDSPWASLIVIVVKKNGQDTRLCIDYKMVDTVTPIMEYSMPVVDDLLTERESYLCIQWMLGYIDDEECSESVSIRLRTDSNDIPMNARGHCPANGWLETFC
ncbi:LOW QUALITY PROTEIN: hypothetical protein PHMEG_0005381 [Phytophthora megakarya]|uniref:Reverse transcriptase n=1 Tax=Phytophthora megakarya TaxID=4795 RepID=A0A225WRN0_9STRA|nr:LOW QUALITY PROTEIN: hypothetical protein PHMEG_0005381 [Phytophthora megakarya]